MHEITYKDVQTNEIQTVYTDTPEVVVMGILQSGGIIVHFSNMPYGTDTKDNARED